MLALDSKETACNSPLEWEVYCQVFRKRPFIVASGSAPQSGFSARTMENLRRFAGRQLLRPCSLALFGLAVAIALWGFSYKISLYHRHRLSPMRSVVAKLWFEPVSDTLATAQRLRSRSHYKSGSHALRGFSQRLPFPASARTAPQPMLKGAVRGLDFPLSTRAPPSRPVCLS